MKSRFVLETDLYKIKEILNRKSLGRRKDADLTWNSFAKAPTHLLEKILLSKILIALQGASTTDFSNQNRSRQYIYNTILVIPVWMD